MQDKTQAIVTYMPLEDIMYLPLQSFHCWVFAERLQSVNSTLMFKLLLVHYIKMCL